MTNKAIAPTNKGKNAASRFANPATVFVGMKGTFATGGGTGRVSDAHKGVGHKAASGLRPRMYAWPIAHSEQCGPVPRTGDPSPMPRRVPHTDTDSRRICIAGSMPRTRHCILEIEEKNFAYLVVFAGQGRPLRMPELVLELEAERGHCLAALGPEDRAVDTETTVVALLQEVE
jgi:hypothetical protein